MPIATEFLFGEEARAWGDHEVRLRRSAESECTAKNRIGAKYLGDGRRRAVARADWLPQGGGKIVAR